MLTVRARSFSWVRDELILALDLYLRRKTLPKSANDPDIIELSQTIRLLPLFPVDQRPDNFRNPTGVYFKLLNFHSIRTGGAAGYSNYGTGDVEVWHEFADDQSRLHAIAEAIRRGMRDPGAAIDDDPIEDIQAPEGRVLLRLHRFHERSAALMGKRKQQALKKHGVLSCEVCGFNFGATYGALGEGFIECHHTVPLSQMRPGHKSRLGDLALVCANCHRMLHRGGEVLTVHALKDQIHAHRGTRVHSK